MGLTEADSFFEDYRVGDVFEHPRGKTVTEMDNVLITNLVMNTAQSHFNEHRQRTSLFKQRVTFGGVTIALAIGLASQDTGENAIAELGLDKIRLKTPVFHGDTIYSFSEVLAVEVRDGASGEVRFRHWAVNQDDKVVFEGERRVLIRRRPS